MCPLQLLPWFAGNVLLNEVFFTSNLKFLSSVYLSVVFQLNVGCFMMDLPSLVSVLCVLSDSAAVMACIATLAALSTTCAIAAFELVCSVAIFAYLFFCFMLLIFEFTLMRLPCYISLIC